MSSHADWPLDEAAAWPKGCLLTNVGVHPRQPWLAAGCTNDEAESGAVLVFDASAGSLRTATSREGGVGWDSDSGLLRWHPDGDRLAVNVDTNGIALLRRAEWAGATYPDQTRDSGVSFVWVGDRIFTDTGALFALDDGPHFDEPPVSPLTLGDVELNTTTGAVVGRTDADGYLQGIAAFDPTSRTLRYHNRLADLKSTWQATIASDGRGYAQAQFGTPDLVQIVDGDDGQQRWTVTPTLPDLRWMGWARDGLLAVLSRGQAPARGAVAPHALDIVVRGRIERTIHIPQHEIRAPNSSLPDVQPVAWSPDGQTIAVLLDERIVRLFDVSRGTELASFDAPVPAAPHGLPDWYRLDHEKRPKHDGGGIVWLSADRLARISRHSVSLWTTQGGALGAWVVPD